MTGYLGAADCDLTIIYGVLVFAPSSGTSKKLTLSELNEDKLFNDWLRMILPLTTPTGV
ncbi:MAG: hypothetical protein M3040_06095 [Bacteroidota bacterium]|nr:hypothetical protein [Bacteroidota bacterium]